MKEQRQPLKPKEIKFIAEKAKGKTNLQAIKAAIPGLSESSLGKVANRMSNKVNVQDELARVFREQGITLDAAIAPISKALIATKVVIHGNKEDSFAEVVDDVDLQLKGSDRALKLMGIGNESVTNNFLIITDSHKDKYGI